MVSTAAVAAEDEISRAWESAAPTLRSADTCILKTGFFRYNKHLEHEIKG